MVPNFGSPLTDAKSGLIWSKPLLILTPVVSSCEETLIRINLCRRGETPTQQLVSSCEGALIRINICRRDETPMRQRSVNEKSQYLFIVRPVLSETAAFGAVAVAAAPFPRIGVESCPPPARGGGLKSTSGPWLQRARALAKGIVNMCFLLFRYGFFLFGFVFPFSFRPTHHTF